MHIGGAAPKVVVRGDDPSTAGQAGAPSIDAPAGAGVGVTPLAGSAGVVVEVVVVFADDDEDSLRDPMNAPSVPATTMNATAPAMIRR